MPKMALEPRKPTFLQLRIKPNKNRVEKKTTPNLFINIYIFTVSSPLRAIWPMVWSLSALLRTLTRFAQLTLLFDKGNSTLCLQRDTRNVGSGPITQIGSSQGQI